VSSGASWCHPVQVSGSLHAVWCLPVKRVMSWTFATCLQAGSARTGTFVRLGISCPHSLWALRGGASALLASPFRTSAANRNVAACPKGVQTPVLRTSAANCDVAANPEVWVRAHSDVGWNRPNLRTGRRRPDRPRLSCQHEDGDDDSQRDEGNPHAGGLPCTGHLDRHDATSFPRAGRSPAPSRRVLQACCGTHGKRLRNGCS
jgi:hypothetical protein